MIKKNKVYRCLQYDYRDSLNFFKKCKSGLYTIFDPAGKKIEQNSYNGLDGDCGEFHVLYMYDKWGKELMWSWYDECSIPKISRVYVNTYDTNGRKIGFCDYSPGDVTICDTLFEKNVVEDTLIILTKSFKKIVYTKYSNTNKKDTLHQRFVYENKGRLDSIVRLDYQLNKIVFNSLQKYYYNSNILDKQEYVGYENKEISQFGTYYYLKNGLLNYAEHTSYYKYAGSNDKGVTKSFNKFKYSFYK